MADKTLDQLDPAGTITGSETLYLVQGGNARRATLNDIAAVLAGLVNAQTIDTPFRGAMVKLDADKTGVTYPYLVEWDSAEYDTDGFFDPAFPTQLVVPEGVTKVRLYAGVDQASGTTYSAAIRFQKNGSGVFPGAPLSNIRQGAEGWTNNTYSLASPPISVAEGDVLEVRVNNSSGGSTLDDIHAAAHTYFAVEVVEFVSP